MTNRFRTSVFIAAGAVVASLAAPLGQAPAAPAPVATSTAAAKAVSVSAAKVVTSARPTSVHSHVDVAWNGRYFFVVWQEASSGTPNSRVYGARVTSTGQVLDPSGILLSDATNIFDNFERPTVAGAPGRFLIAWEQQIEGTYSDLDAAMVNNAGTITKTWSLSNGDNGQSRPDATWSGQLFLVVWQDEPDADNEDIFGTRVTSDGLTLDGCSSDSCPLGDDVGIPVLYDPTADQRDPAVTSGNGLFLVSFADNNAATPPDIGSNAVALQGSPLATASTPLSQAAGSQTTPATARNGETVLTSWSDTRSGPAANIYATRTRPLDDQNYNPFPLDPNGIAVSTAAGQQTLPSVTTRGTGFLVSWADTRSGNSDIFASRVGPGGAVFNPGGIAIAATAQAETEPSSATGGGKQLVAYQRGTRIAFRLLS
jgi:hypothetical protein